MSFETMEQIEQYVQSLNYAQLLTEVSKYRKVGRMMKTNELKGILTEILVNELNGYMPDSDLNDDHDYHDDNGNDDDHRECAESDSAYVEDQGEDADEGGDVLESRGRKPRKLTVADRKTTRGYKRLIKFFEPLELVGNLDAQMEFVKNAHQFWQESQNRRRKGRSSKIDIDTLREFLKQNPEILEQIKNSDLV